MARSRNIKPGFFVNEDLVELDFATRLLFAGLWTLADREGRLEDRPKKIKIGVFPADNVDVDTMLQELHDAKFIERYEVNGTRYVKILNWHKHQNPHHTEKQSEIPDVNGELTVKTRKQPASSESEHQDVNGDSTVNEVEHDGGNLADSGFLIPDSLIPEPPLSPTGGGRVDPPSAPEGFSRFWQAWPKSERKQARGQCLKAWQRAGAEKCAVTVLAHVERMKLSESWTKEAGQFVPAPLVYLNQRRWEGADGEGDAGECSAQSRHGVFV